MRLLNATAQRLRAFRRSDQTLPLRRCGPWQHTCTRCDRSGERAWLRHQGGSCRDPTRGYKLASDGCLKHTSAYPGQSRGHT